MFTGFVRNYLVFTTTRFIVGVPPRSVFPNRATTLRVSSGSVLLASPFGDASPPADSPELRHLGTLEGPLP